MLEVWCLAKGLEFTAVGSWTLESKQAQRGVEPDECYCPGEHAALEDPKRPDLAIEVIHTSGSIPKLEVYEKLGVPEVWIWKNERLFVRAPDGAAYREIERSRLLPELDIAQLWRLVYMRPMSRAVREYRSEL